MKTTKIDHGAYAWQRCSVLIVALLIIALSPAYAGQVTSGVSFAQVSFTASNSPEMYSHYGQVSIDYTALYGEGYVNVERYQDGEAAGWVVKNLPVINGSVLSGFSTMFDLGASGYQSSVSAYVEYSSAPLADDNSLKNQTPVNYPLGQAEYPVLPPPDEVTGEMTYKADNAALQKAGDDKYAGTYVFVVVATEGTKETAATVKITQKKGPEKKNAVNTDGCYVTIPATYDKKTGFTFDAKHVDYFNDKDRKVNWASFKGSFVDGKLTFETAVKNDPKENGLWTFKTK